jgi:hypothetical protein
LERIDFQEMEIMIAGDSPLIMHKWSDKAKKEILDKQMKKAKTGKQAKDPVQDYLDSMYWMDGQPESKDEAVALIDSGKARFGFPAVAFKNAAVTAVTQVDGMTKVLARGVFHVNLGDELVEIVGQPRMREDMVRVGMGTADIRYRGEFPEWSAQLRIRYNASVVSAEQIVNLFRLAGFAVGIAEWRPEKDGSYGMFHVE